MNSTIPSALFLSCAALLLPGGAPASRAADAPPALAIDTLVSEVLANNPELAFYEAEIDAARAALASAGARADPELAFEIGRKRVAERGGILAGEGTAWSVSVSQVFAWPGRLPLRKAIANRDLALAELGLDRFRAALASRARLLAHGLHAAHERAAAKSEVAARYRELREVFLAREPGGITPLLETRVIEAQELALQHAATDAQLAVQSALVELNQLRGYPVDTLVRISAAPLVLPPPPSVETMLAAAREHDFEFRAARIELEQQGLHVSLARQEARPGITLGPYYAEEQAGERERTLGLAVSLPLPVSGRAGAGIAMAEARRRQAEAALLVAGRALERDVVTAAHAYAARVEAASRWSPDAARRFRDAAALADRHYRLGAVPIGTYVELQNSYLEAIDAIYDTLQEALEAARTLELLTGLAFPAREVAP